MDKKVLKGITIFLTFFTVAMIVCLYFLPRIEVKNEQTQNQMQAVTTLNKKDAIITSPNEVVVEETAQLGQIEIQLPENMDEAQLKIEEDAVMKQIFIEIPGGGPDYFKNYLIRGKSDHISSMAYYEQDGMGVILLEMDHVYEVKKTIEHGSLFVDFVNPHEVYDKIVVIDAGHGSKAVGAVSRGVNEKDINLAIVLELKKIFDENKDAKIGVYYTRLDDSNPSFQKRVQLANDLDANLFLSVHNNTSKSGSGIISGTQVMYQDGNTGEISSEHLAEICLNQVSQKLGSRSVGLIEDDGTYIIANSMVPAALIEVGFMTNREELEKLNSAEYQKKAAEGIYEAIKQAIEEGY